MHHQNHRRQTSSKKPRKNLKMNQGRVKRQNGNQEDSQDIRDMPPGNNLAERTLRLAVTKRKVSGGSRSMERFQDTANLLTVIQTCRHQGRSVIDFFDQAIKAMVHPTVQTPSLIPQI
ncbi:MAG: transposase [Nostoc sp. EspVER01]|nr:transposase [Nostoc sp. EspVER01]MDZ7995587.1 transposase [Nostoc sp. EspVER01]